MESGGSDGWKELEGDWLYLGRQREGEYDIALLHGPDGLFAPLFSERRSGTAFASVAPESLELLPVAADDLRAKEEWLRAALEQGATVVAFDPHPQSPRLQAALPIQKALWYVLSHKTGSACI